MVKLMRCLQCREDISLVEFRRFWNDPNYEALLKKLVDMSQAISFTSSITLQIDINQELAEIHGTSKPFDGVVVVAWENAQAVLAMRNDDEGLQSIDDVLAFEDQFIDRTQSRYFFTE